MKYLIGALPLVLCVEVISYVCLCVLAVMLVWDILKAMEGKW